MANDREGSIEAIEGPFCLPGAPGSTARPTCFPALVHQAVHDIQADRPEAFADLAGMSFRQESRSKSTPTTRQGMP